jgi:transglutaminase-like putative cysteine protease
MRLSIIHETKYRYVVPADYTIQYLRLSPQTTIQQKVLSWNLDLPRPAAPFSDGFGNTSHVLVIDKPHQEIRIRAYGEVDVEDSPTNLPNLGPLGPDVYMRFTALTAQNEALNRFSETFRRQTTNNRAAGVEALMSAVREEMDYRPGDTQVGTTAAQAFSKRAGVCHDHAHVFVSCCRKLNIPARYVSGYLAPKNRLATNLGPRAILASHAWAEAWIEGLGWQGFDVANHTRAHGRHVRVAVGLDYLDACPVRGFHRGGKDESLDVEVQVNESACREDTPVEKPARTPERQQQHQRHQRQQQQQQRQPQL